jgi:uncharacterized tellurite resistance protein B-like protein
MFGSFKALMSSLVEDPRPAGHFESRNGRLAAAALLIRVATVDGEMSEARLGRLHAVLQSGFDLDDLATVKLIEHADVAARRAIDLYHFTRQLNAAFDDEGRRRVVEMMWQIILVDGSARESENNIVWRAADLLGVPSRQRIDLRRRIAAERAAAIACSPTRR